MDYRDIFADQVARNISLLDEAIRKGDWSLVRATYTSLLNCMAMLGEMAGENDEA